MKNCDNISTVKNKEENSLLNGKAIQKTLQSMLKEIEYGENLLSIPRPWDDLNG